MAGANSSVHKRGQNQKLASVHEKQLKKSKEKSEQSNNGNLKVAVK